MWKCLKPTSLHVRVKHCTFKAVSVGPHQHNPMLGQLESVETLESPTSSRACMSPGGDCWCIHTILSIQTCIQATISGCYGERWPPLIATVCKIVHVICGTPPAFWCPDKTQANRYSCRQQYFQALSKQMSTFWMIWWCKRWVLYNSWIKMFSGALMNMALLSMKTQMSP